MPSDVPSAHDVSTQYDAMIRWIIRSRSTHFHRKYRIKRCHVDVRCHLKRASWKQDVDRIRRYIYHSI